MKQPYMPKNAYEVAEIREEIKNYLERIEKVKRDEYGNILVDGSNIINMVNIEDKLRQGILLADCLLYMMSFSGGGEQE